jgi:DNA repair protein RecO
MASVGAGTHGDAAQRLGYAAYFAELLDEWAQEGQANERLFRLGASVGAAVGQGSIDALARYFEYWLLRLEGVYPGLHACARCARPSLGAGAVLADRHYVCLDCESAGLRLSKAAMTFLGDVRTAPPTAAAAARVPAVALRELEHVHQRLITIHLEREPRSARVVKELRPHL